MAELATIARPYAEALFKARASLSEVQLLAAVAADPQLVRLADNPKVDASLVFDVVSDVLARKGMTLSDAVANFLRAAIDNGRVSALTEIAAQLQRLINSESGVSDATIHSAFAIEPAQLADVVAWLEQRFGRKLNARVAIDPGLIGGIRVVVGDEVLDTSIKARLEQMKLALTA